MKNILITGANGYIGKNLVKSLTELNKYKILCVVSTVEKFELLKSQISNCENIYYISNDQFIDEYNTNEVIDVAVHLASSRANAGSEKIAEGIRYSERVFKKFKELRVKRVINISSQSVYGNTSDIRHEYTPVNPNTLYALSKYAIECLLDAIMSDCECEYTNVRLDSVIQSQRIVSIFSSNIKTSGKIHITGGKQVFSYIDIEDAVLAIIDLLEASAEYKRVYNVGLNESRINIVELAEMLIEIGKEDGYSNLTYSLDENDNEIWAGMNSELFSKDTGWTPKLSLYDSIKKVYINS